ncbi:MAG: HAD-IB family phosphatase [Methanomassiliicoccales archaeon]|nr:HAD-IB family phosphatase [Methanomassiliicoccales archaeon]
MLSNGRKFDLVAFDMDGVLVDYLSSWSWVHDRFGVSNEESVISFMDGDIDDMEFMRRDIALWLRHRPGLRLPDVEQELLRLPINPGIGRTVEELRGRGVRTVIISGGLDLIAEKLAKEYRFDAQWSNGLAADLEGRLTGEGVLRVELCNKRKVLQEAQELFDISPERTASIGNSSIDVSMFKGSSLGIAFNPIDEDVVQGAHHVVRDASLSAVLPYLI